MVLPSAFRVNFASFTESFPVKVNETKLASLETVVVSVVPKQDVRKTMKEESRINLKELNFICKFF